MITPSSSTRVTACSGEKAAKAAGATKKAKPKPIAAWTEIPTRTATTTRTSSPLTARRISVLGFIP